MVVRGRFAVPMQTFSFSLFFFFFFFFFFFLIHGFLFILEKVVGLRQFINTFPASNCYIDVEVLGGELLSLSLKS